MNHSNSKIALVTGASRGIGHAILLALAKKGFFVVGTATTETGCGRILEALTEGRFPGAAVVLDVTSETSVQTACTKIVNEYASPQILVNNAGIVRDALLLRMKEEDWLAVLETNLTGVYRLSKLCLKNMLKLEWGRIINIGSVIGSTGNPGQIAYATSKAGLEGFTKALAREVGGRNITVNTVAPGFIETDMTKDLTQTQREAVLAQIPLKRLGKPEDVAGLVAFLVSEEASYVTGQTIHVNGGMYLH